ncbi:MAG TPA: sigma 54-interacting transcriptional regulator, partial [Gammaproteobacteria bacterium]|nr:sigma 54-interacting transcriptional regulator [Gammaproteobacteria bacterium]
STGRIPEKSPRSVITRSWQISRKLGINPEAERASTVLSLEEIEDRLHRQQLGQAGVPVIEKLLQKFEGSEHVIVLADNDGCILHSTGHRLIRQQLDAINFMPGARWSEESVGPNGVGTPLALGQPEVVMGHEHYCRGWQPWVCYGAPVFNTAAGRVVGVVDITGPVRKASSEAMILAVSVAQSVQYGLNALALSRREYLRTLSRDIVNRWSGQGVLLSDEDGYIIDHNSKVMRYLDQDSAGILNRPLTELIPGIWDTVHARINNNSYGEINIDVRGDFGIHRPVQIHIEPVSNGNQCYGAVLILSGNNIIRDERVKNASQPELKNTFDHMLGQSSCLKNAIRQGRAAAEDPLENGVLLIGEKGTGKKLLARSIHSAGSRGEQPFVIVNCDTLPADMMETELFGCVPGLFSGARRNGLTGKIEKARNGTLYLEGINLLGAELQAALLHVLANGQIIRAGSNEPLRVNTRLIASADREIYRDLDVGKFRPDLYHHLCVFEIPVPPLRDRGDDITALASAFLEEECWYANRDKLFLTDEVRPFLKRYHWPGNVRELRNLCLRWVLTVGKCNISLEHLPEKILIARCNEPVTTDLPVNENLKSHNDEIIRQVLARTGGNISEAARILGINRTTIYRWKKKSQQ